MLQDFFLGFIKRYIWHHAAHTTVSELTVMPMLTQHDCEVSLGTLYPLPLEIELTDYLAYEDRIVWEMEACRSIASSSGPRSQAM
jgi:hypothetical protein